MADIDIEKLPIDLHGIALANGLPSGITAHPAFKAFMREYKRAFAALVLEEAAKRADAERTEFMEQACRNDGRHSDMAFGSVNSSERIAAAIRTMAEGLKK